MSPGVVAQFASVETVGGQVTNLQGQPRHLHRDLHDHRLDRDRRRRASCSSSPGRSRSGCTVSNKGWAAFARGGSRLSSSGCAALEPKPKPAPAIRDQRRSLSLDLRPLSGRPDRHPPRDGVRRRRPADRRRHGRLRRRRASRRSAGPSSPVPPARSRSTAPASG